jgi:hypothetical protein
LLCLERLLSPKTLSHNAFSIRALPQRPIKPVLRDLTRLTDTSALARVSQLEGQHMLGYAYAFSQGVNADG